MTVQWMTENPQKTTRWWPGAVRYANSDISDTQRQA